MTDAKQLFNELESALSLAGSYERLPILLDYAMCFGGADGSEWLRLLGEEWSMCDNIGRFAEELTEAVLFHHWSDGPIKPMMDDAELEAFDKLPDVLTIYRGCYAKNKWGFSWSLDRTIAESFPFLWRYRADGRPLLVKATIHKSKVAALKLGRDESEIITFQRPKCVSISTARPQPKGGTQ